MRFMNIVTGILILLLSTNVFAQDKMENYKKEVVLNLKRGKGPGEIGYYKDGPEDGEGLRFGPDSFEITDDGTILILDTRNKRMICFNDDGQVVNEFPIHGTGETLLDDQGNLYINYGSKNTILVYSHDGRLQKKIIYANTGLTSYNLWMRNGKLYLYDSVFEINKNDIKMGELGEEIIPATLRKITKEEHPRYKGQATGKYYKSISNTYFMKGKSGSDINVFEGFLNKSDWSVFLREDKYGNSYFFAGKNNSTSQYVLKVSPEARLIAIIGPLGLPWYTEYQKQIIIKGDDVYQLHCSKDGVLLYKWSK